MKASYSRNRKRRRDSFVSDFDNERLELVSQVEMLRNELERLKRVTPVRGDPMSILKHREAQRRAQEIQSILSGNANHRVETGVKRPNNISAEHKTEDKPDVDPLRVLRTGATRMYPVRQGEVDILKRSSKEEIRRWITARAHRHRFSHSHGMMSGALDDAVKKCTNCNVDRLVDREGARAVCPMCGNTKTFASHVLEYRENDRPDAHLTMTKGRLPSHLNKNEQKMELSDLRASAGGSSGGGSNNNYTQKFTSQFGRGHPLVPIPLMARLCAHYNTHHHTPDPFKVRCGSTTGKILKGMSDVPRVHKNSSERVTMELLGEPIPEMSHAELAQLMELRDLHAMETGTKAVSNSFTMRVLARSMGCSQARLFPPTKTQPVHHAAVDSVSEWLAKREDGMKHLYPCI